jgi:hypothetical protein
MAYASWSVVFSEQPSAAKWNILGTNDASFNDGTGIATGAITPVKRSGGFVAGQISAATFSSTGNKSVTGVGFTPKFVMFFVMPSAATNASTNAYGAMTTTIQFNTWASSNSAGNTSSRNNSTTACVGWGTSSASSYNMAASYVSMDADGFTINVGTADGTFAVQYIAFG